MAGRDLFKFVLPRIADSIDMMFDKFDGGMHDVDTYVMHQANYRIIDAVSRKLNIPMDKFIVNIDRVGNTSAATIPLVTDEFIHTFKPGDTLMFSSFGAGVVWGSVLMRY
jgi:3-oxoacyl-[acyl-carrier-protein] synthase-3